MTQEQDQDRYVLEFQPGFEAALKQGARPREVAEHLTRLLSALPMLAEVLGAISPEQVLAALERNDRGSSPLCQPDGQKFLGDVKAELEALRKAAQS